MRKVWIAACVAALLGAPAGSAARAAYDPVASGRTVLRFDKRFLAVLKRNGIRVSARQGAAFRSGALTFPVTGGKFDPRTEEGVVEHGGAAALAGAGASIPLKDLQLKTTRRASPLAIRLGGGQLKLGRAGSVSVARSGFGERIAVAGLTLSAKVAARLSKRLHLRGAFVRGMPLGSAVTRANPETVTIEGRGRASFELDPGMTAKLNDLHVAVNPIFPAEHPGAFTLAVSGGKLAPDLSGGRLETQGGLEFLQLGGGQVTWSDSVFDLDAGALAASVDEEPAPPYAGKVGQAAVGALALPPGSLAEDPRGRTLSVSGATVALGADAARAFNEAFARPQERGDVFVAGEPLGRVSFRAEAR